MGVRDVITGRLLSTANVKFSDAQIADTLQLLITHGVKRGANVIHIEPHEHYVLIRYRIDGILRGVHKLPSASAGLLVQHIKRLASLESTQSPTPQEGSYATEVDKQSVGVRVSLVPVWGGEKAVLHLTPAHASLAELTTLGYWGANLDTVHEALSRPQGLITVAGPRRGGKTTTLYSMLQLLHNPTHSIATVEESNSKKLPGISQSYIHPGAGITLSKGLQATLQQDPNIIMIGNVPDKETAEIVTHAAATGHLMLAELHADDAITSALYMRSLVSAPFLLATALRLSIGQRLVRQLCPSCRVRYELDGLRREKLNKAFGINTTAARKRLIELEQAAQQSNVGEGATLHATPNGISHVWRARAGGCEQCDHSGFKGQISINEVLKNDESMQKRFMSQETLTSHEIHRAALKEGFVPMGLDGLVKALRGLTTVIEILRAVGRISS